MGAKDALRHDHVGRYLMSAQFTVIPSSHKKKPRLRLGRRR